jgi:hypothetical protein
MAPEVGIPMKLEVVALVMNDRAVALWRMIGMMMMMTGFKESD